MGYPTLSTISDKSASHRSDLITVISASGVTMAARIASRAIILVASSNYLCSGCTYIYPNSSISIEMTILRQNLINEWLAGEVSIWRHWECSYRYEAIILLRPASAPGMGSIALTACSRHARGSAPATVAHSVYCITNAVLVAAVGSTCS